MPLVPFNSSASLTLGVELELQLIDLKNFNLTAASPVLLEILRQKKFPGNVTPEITESMIEVETDVHTGYVSLLSQLFDIRSVLIHTAERLNIGICGGGTHPFQMWSEQRIFNKPRFQKISLLYGYLAKQITVFGQHIHIGCTNGDEALFLLHSLNRYISHFIALSASSPFVQRNDTQFNSARLNSLAAFPLSGTAPFLLSWEKFEKDFFAKMMRTSMVHSMKDFYWDVRPKPEFGTIELRICDTPLSMERAAALACYLQTLCHYLLEHHDPDPIEDDYLVYNYNRFQACRFGLFGILLHPKTYERISLREDIKTTIQKLQPHAEKLGCVAALQHINQIASKGNDTSYLRKQYHRYGNLEDVVGVALQRF